MLTLRWPTRIAVFVFFASHVMSAAVQRGALQARAPGGSPTGGIFQGTPAYANNNIGSPTGQRNLSVNLGGSRASGSGEALGIHFFPRIEKPIILQAYSAVLFGALEEVYDEYGTSPNSVQTLYTRDDAGSEPKFASTFSVRAITNGTAPSQLTNRRLVAVLGLLGYDFSQTEHLESLVELDFDVVLDIANKETVIAKGQLENTSNNATVTTA